MFTIPVILLKVSDVWFYNYCVISRCPYSYIGSKMNTEYIVNYTIAIDTYMFCFCIVLQEHDTE